MAGAPGVRRSELGDALRTCRHAFIGVGIMSCAINVLYLTGSIFMLEVYDRVLPSRSVPTLIGLAILAGGMYLSQGILDLIRGRILGRIGTALDESLNRRVFDTMVRLPLVMGARNEGLQPLRDLDAVRSFLSGMGPGAFFDLPWLPFYLAICFAFHFVIGLTALVGAIILVGLTLVTEYLSRAPAREATGLAARRNDLAATSRRNAEVLVAMGMSGRLTNRWSEANEKYLTGNQYASDIAGGLGAISKVLRMTLQSAVLGVGAYLVIYQQATAGIIIAGSILSARALAPVDLAIAHWRSFVAARQSWYRLNRLLEQLPPRTAQTLLQEPSSRLSVETVSIVPPGEQKVIVQDVNFVLEAGRGLGIIGPSGSGKSSLVRALVGVWQPFRGKVRLDGAALDQWSPDVLGRHIGYLPQDVELFAGTVAQNICRFDPDAVSDGIIAAAKEAGVHQLIIKMRDGYDTQVGEQGHALSAGQAQRVALARALYGNPFLIVLDEPNSNLDTEGDEALTRAIRAARERGAIVVVVAHRPVGIEGVDQLLVLKEGRMQAFGPKETVLGQVIQRVAPPTPIKIVSEGGVKK
ncbi:MAG: type I secretion system permease/ATPase [Bradyrhizobium sp.]|uniref:type I secretion system permease/ATPase n=1 Tax=Bradyrhizobium sp. TaxID=376 RepID=UPI001C297FCD|nr:type I secretion system permease/ATPase [Bradyrhizobium sp.]MBU6462105.1 type I secretion system permease/ATPase [Pseudomonadota bacterium]MDE2066836.1 type I secretion system permease/ATPase [Bradyrhizobium sp.]MDE2241913.1 type I secretion system permease/ATPase [Bradyrhizobium sp.]